MDIDTITQDISQHIDKLFYDVLEIVNHNFDFMDEHELIEPKKDYLILTNYLNKTINHFSNLDYDFSDDTLKKLLRDVNNLNTLYEEQKKSMNNIEKLFTTKIFPKIGLFTQMQTNLINLKKSDMMDSVDLETGEIIKEHFSDMQAQYIEMRKIYLEIFAQEYIQQNKEALQSLEIILNCKIFYLDKFLWLNVFNAPAILRALNIHEDEKFSSKEYLKLRISVALPYTEDYAYLQKCLRTYR